MFLLSIKNRADFTRISKNNCKFYSKTILLLTKKSPEKYLYKPNSKQIINFCRVGYTVTKSCGNAVVRNKIKRRFRAAFNLLLKNQNQNQDRNNLINNHFDYVLIARKEAASADFKIICQDLEFCLKGIKNKK